MARIDLYRAGRRVQSLPLHSGRRWLVGRDPDADMVLADELASRRHFHVHVEDKGWRIDDLDTPNGTLVNGVREYGRAMPTACTLQVGAEILIFDPDAAPDTPVDDEIPNWALAILGDEDHDAPSTCHMAPAKLRQVQARERARTRPHLVEARAADAQVWPLDHKVTHVGLGPVHIPVNQSANGKPRVLAAVARKPNGSYVVKAHGLFGRVTVNGASTRSAALSAGDVLEVGGVMLRFFPGLQGCEAS